MINAIAELGKYEKAKNPNIKSNSDIWLEDSYDEKNYPHLLLIKRIPRCLRRGSSLKRIMKLFLTKAAHRMMHIFVVIIV